MNFPYGEDDGLWDSALVTLFLPDNSGESETFYINVECITGESC